MKLVLAPRAAREAERAVVWWRENRPAARGLFEDELRSALDRVCATPLLGPVYQLVGEREVRRVLLPETRYHVYYRVTGNDLVRVLAIWSAVRGRGPRL